MAVAPVKSTVYKSDPGPWNPPASDALKTDDGNDDGGWGSLGLGADVDGSHAAAPREGEKGKKERRKKESRQKRRAAKELEEYGHLDQSWKSFRTPDDSDRARHSGRYSLAPAGGRDEGSMLVEPELMRRWEAKRVPSKTPEAARGSADPLNLQSDRKMFARRRELSDWLHVEKLPQGAQIETLIDDPETGTRLATISQFLSPAECARLRELVDTVHDLPGKRVSVDQVAIRAYRYAYIGRSEDALVAEVEERMAAVTGLPAHSAESRMMLSEYKSLPRSHPYAALNNIHLDIDEKPDRVATFILCASDTSPLCCSLLVDPEAVCLGSQTCRTWRKDLVARRCSRSCTPRWTCRLPRGTARVPRRTVGCRGRSAPTLATPRSPTRRLRASR